MLTIFSLDKKKSKVRFTGFTLVELLVVIGIIAILAGVALGPITAGIKKAQQNAAVQSSRTITVAEFQYANDNGEFYPYGSDSGEIASTLMEGGYVSDPGLFFILGSPHEKKYTGTGNPPSVMPANVSWDFGIGVSSGLTSTTPEDGVAVISTGGTPIDFSTDGPLTSQTTQDTPFGFSGMVVCYKNNAAKFLISPPASNGVVQVEDSSWVGYSMSTVAGNG